jgi:uroporphyrinogen-III synthase
MNGRLAGRRIFITRPERDAGSLGDLLRAEGAEPIEAPAIIILPAEDTDPLDEALQDVWDGEYEWICVTSPACVEQLDVRLVEIGLAPPLPLKVAAVGAATARDLKEKLLTEPDLVPSEFNTRALAAQFPRGSGRVLLPRVDIAPPGLEEALQKKGWTPVRVTAYRTRHPEALPPDAEEALTKGEIDALVFSSSSTVDGFVQMAGLRRGPKVVAIGPVTAQTAHEHGFTVDEVAEPHTIEGIVQALIRIFEGE